MLGELDTITLVALSVWDKFFAYKPSEDRSVNSSITRDNFLFT